jgi:protease I
MGSVLMVIAPDQFRDEEYVHPREELEAKGIRVVTASVAPGPCRGKLGMIAKADLAVCEAEPDEYDAVVFVGGPGAAVYFDDADAHALVSRMADSGRVVAAICIAPSILARAGLLDDVPATCFPTQQEDLEEHGARYTGLPVEVAAGVITANGPEAAREFGRTVADAIST